MDSGDVIQLIVLLILLLLSAFFSSAETAMTTVNKIYIMSLVNEGNKRAKILQKIIDNPGKLLSTILIGNNIVNLSASSLATTWTTRVLGNAFVGIATGILTLLVLLFGEITPKTMATLYAEKLSMSYAPVIYFLMKVLTYCEQAVQWYSVYTGSRSKGKTKHDDRAGAENHRRCKP